MNAMARRRLTRARRRLLLKLAFSPMMVNLSLDETPIRPGGIEWVKAARPVAYLQRSPEHVLRLWPLLGRLP